MANRKNIEDRMLDQINLNEGLLGTLFKSIVKQKVKRSLVRKLRDDPELQAMLADLEKNRERVEDRLNKYCEKYPQSRNCKGGKRRR